MISIENLSVAFGGVTALNAVTVELTQPVCGIIGPNGAGKTTLLNVLSGFVLPQSGSIHMMDTNILPMKPHGRARWGLRRSFQKEQVVDELTVEDNVLVLLDQLGLSATERLNATAAALEFVGLSVLRRVSAGGLNAFERRMIEIARCVVGRPRVILLDEPGAGFSQGEVEKLRQVISSFHDATRSITLLIDHDVDLIQAVCRETMVLDFGSLIAVGNTASVLTDEKVRAVYLGMEDAA
ncbi:ATP-binding cassette domain-containing protein [Mesorhizobium sp. M8A.F.Ca.ET.207.01.1.1]|uniref:ABC transporter ATP-binding protein n=1 Tax=Mesorhizobium sp. M8A.F.Ca.ET.207.01.1.1 TaxID=2563968 RepID=UPI00109CC17C|nr:ATP-binding cassette domain-containing protein [Mesorhizobium sp. M8A.F.Ca.ET.207.01.1.1]TGQ77228.1 ATP-binding cassette domain-containing protein [Mesorhizobium sp. M8A.F.Ca.ET.207.01.1.1]